MIRLCVLGSTSLDADGRELTQVLAQPKRLALLAYLAVCHGFHRRDALLALFWPELDTVRSRDALNQAVRFLRKELGGSPESIIISRGAGELGIEPGSFWCDVAAFRAAIEARRYDEALDLYRGDFLAGFFADGASGFESWLELERPRLRSAAARAAMEVADAQERTGDHASAISSARRAVELAGQDERVVRDLMARLDRLGDRAGAIYAYERFAASLAKELEAQPAAETTALLARIRSRRLAAESNDPASGVDLPSPVSTARPAVAAVSGRKSAARRYGLYAAAILVAIASIAAWRKTSSFPPSTHVTMDAPGKLKFGAGEGFNFALSRDGQVVAFVTAPDRKLYLQRLGSQTAVPVPNADSASDLHFSPDGKWLAFRSPGTGGGPSIIRIDGRQAENTPTQLDSTRGWSGIAWTWSRDLVYVWDNALWRVAVPGGTPRLIAAMDTTVDYRWRQPVILGDGKTIVFRVRPRGAESPHADRLAIISIDGGPRTMLDVVSQGAIGYSDGYLLYSRIGPRFYEGQIVAVKFDLRRRKRIGEPVVLADSVDLNTDVGALAAISENGTLAYMSSAPAEILRIVDRRGGILAEHGGLRFARQTMWSPDGDRIAMYTGSDVSPVLSVFDVTSGVMTQLPEAAGIFPSWTSDSKRVVFTAFGPDGSRSGPAMWVPIDGSSPPQRIPGTEIFGSSVLQALVSPDNKYVVVRRTVSTDDDHQTLHAFVVPMAGGEPKPAIPETPNPWELAISPDGKFLAYHASDGNGPRVFVRGLTQGQGRVQVSTERAFGARWIGRERLVFYQQGAGFRVATLDTQGALPRVLRTEPLLESGSAMEGYVSMNVHPDGRKIAITKNMGSQQKLNVITNWPTLLREKIGQ